MGFLQRLNQIEREAVYQMRECFCEGRKSTLYAETDEEKAALEQLAELAIFPEKPVISFVSGDEKKNMPEIFRYAGVFTGKEKVRRFVTCGGVDDGKSTLIGRIIYEAATLEEQEAFKQNLAYLRTDGTIDLALLAGCSEEEARQGITVQVSYSAFRRGDYDFLMADVPGHEEYTYNMAYAALGAEAAVVMIAANKGIVPQTRRHMRICYFMGIRSVVFAVNKMDLVSYSQEIFLQIEKEIAGMMQEYPECSWKIVPVAAKAGENITVPCVDMPWYQKSTLLEAIQNIQVPMAQTENTFCMQVQRICKSSQMSGAKVKKRVIQGAVISGTLSCGEEVCIYPTGEKSKVTGLYALDQSVAEIEEGVPAGIEMERELDIARGYILTKEDNLSAEERIEADILWTADNRLTPGKRYEVRCGSRKTTAVITKICYQIDVNTGEHKYAEYLVKNALARCEISFPTPFIVTNVNENRALGTFLLMDRTEHTLAAYGNVTRTISEGAWKEESRPVTATERERAMGQKAGLVFFEKKEDTAEWMNFIEHCLLRMGFHTMQPKELSQVNPLLEAGLILLLQAEPNEKSNLEVLLPKKQIYDCATEGLVPKQIKRWASKLIE
ncbi:MAG: hypothetical protein J6A92_07665 [Lachnospiraceae bacterium]|nr:hypothetical protein [Lachnospiraceae bacterium]